MTRALVLFAHPCPESFSSALHKTVVETLETRGWEVDDCDLNAEGFQPVLTEEERRGYHDEPENRAPVQSYIDRLQAADSLICVFPVWNFGYPAILKGFFDRVFLPGVSFRLVDGKVRPNLTHIKRLAAVTTYGGTWTRATLCGNPPRAHFTRSLWHVTRPHTLKYLALYDMNRASEGRRARFIDRIESEMRRF